MSIRKRQTISDMIDDYFDTMEKWANQMAFSEKPCWDLKNCAIEPLREITVTPSEVMITVDLPLARTETIHIDTVGQASLEITAEMRKQVSLTELGLTHREGIIQRFDGWIRVPVPVRMDKMKVQHKKGILEIRIPRRILRPKRHGKR